METVSMAFTDEQVKANAKILHAQVHKLLVAKDPSVEDSLFATDEEFLAYFRNLMERLSGMNTLLGCPDLMISLMSNLQAAYNMCDGGEFDFRRFRRLILDSHGLLTQMFGDTRDA